MEKKEHQWGQVLFLAMFSLLSISPYDSFKEKLVFTDFSLANNKT